jgi:uncharacterized protein
MPMGFRRKGPRRGGTKLFFATDVHGSDRCFRKFLNAGTFYGARHLVLGGDITGKSLIPVERTATGWRATHGDHRYVDMTDAECAELEQRIRDNGDYPIRGERDELEALRDESHREKAFTAAVVAGIERWVALAEERLAGTGIRCFVTPGNDDFWEIDAALQGSDVVEFVEGRCVELDETHEMITTGYSNPTPWETPRELSEEAMSERIEEMFRHVKRPETLVAVLHPPPHDTELDLAPAIDEEFRIRMSGGTPVMAPVGSTAVREFVERRQPLLGLHGHVHDSKAAQKIGRTLCINPGSEYPEGVLCGCVVTLRGEDPPLHQLTVG